jgi:hypothetical protein
MALPDVAVTIGTGGLGRRKPSLDYVCGLVTTGVAAGDLELNTSYRLNALSDLEALGIDAAYDTDNELLVYHQVKRFFQRNPNGELWLRVAAQTVTLSQLLDPTATHAKSLLTDAGGRIRRLGATRNPASGYTPTLTTGLDANVLTAIAKAKLLIDEEATRHFNLGCILVEGRSYNGAVASAADLRALASDGVGVVILQDLDVVTAAGYTECEGYAEVGAVLGDRSRAAVNVDTMWVEKFNLQDIPNAALINPGLSSNLAINTYTDANLGVLHDKGYIFGRTYPGVAGVYLNGNPACAAVDSDFAWLNDTEVIAKAARLVYARLLPKLGSPVTVDSTTGKLEAGFVAYMEREGHQALQEMEQALEISGKDVFVDPDQNVLSTSTVAVKFSVVPTGTARSIEATISFTNPFV